MNTQLSKRQRKSLGYGPRREALARCGFATYGQYLASDLWKEIRARVLERDHGLCVACARKATQVHHKRYNDGTLLGHRLTELVSLCGGCHEAVEFRGGKKVSLADTKRRLKKRARMARRRTASRPEGA